MATVDAYAVTSSLFTNYAYSQIHAHDNIVSSPVSGASTPSLRARHSVYIPMAQPGDLQGNVKVVVRVRKFLPRGETTNSASPVNMLIV